MSHPGGVEIGLKEVKKSCTFYKGVAARLALEELERCESTREDATEMLYELEEVESTLDRMRSDVVRTRTNILSVLKKMDAVIETKKKEAEEAKAAKAAKAARAAKGEKKKGKSTPPPAKKAKTGK